MCIAMPEHCLCVLGGATAQNFCDDAPVSWVCRSASMLRASLRWSTCYSEDCLGAGTDHTAIAGLAYFARVYAARYAYGLQVL